MSQKFNGSVQHRGDASLVKLGGIIDEDNELSDLIDKIPSGTAIIDLGEIERINSCGVRDWVNWLSKLEANGTRSVLVECSPAIVAQINLVNNFTGSGVVKSFYVPYFCPECDEEKVLLVEAADMGPPPHEPPTCRCDECDLVMDFDDMPDSYFAFLSNQKKVGDRASLARELGPPDPSVAGRNKVRSRASLPSITSSAASSMSVPSLPSIQRSGQSSASHAAAVAAVNAKAASRPQQGTGPNPALFRPSGSRPPPSRPPASRPPGNGHSSTGVGMNGGTPGMPMGRSSHVSTSQPVFSPTATPSAPTILGGAAIGQPSRGSGLVLALILVLVAAIGILIYLVASK